MKARTHVRMLRKKAETRIAGVSLLLVFTCLDLALELSVVPVILIAIIVVVVAAVMVSSDGSITSTTYPIKLRKSTV